MVFSFVLIQTNDVEKSVLFYRELMGMSVTREFTAGPNHIVMLKGDGCGIELISGPQSAAACPGPCPVLGFEVDDLDAVLDTMCRQGVPIVDGPHSPQPGVRLVMVRDPNGVTLELLEQRGADAAQS